MQRLPRLAAPSVPPWSQGKEKKDVGGGSKCHQGVGKKGIISFVPTFTQPMSLPGWSGPVPCSCVAFQGPLRLWPGPVLDWGHLCLSHYLLLLAL